MAYIMNMVSGETYTHDQPTPSDIPAVSRSAFERPPETPWPQPRLEAQAQPAASAIPAGVDIAALIRSLPD